VRQQQDSVLFTSAVVVAAYLFDGGEDDDGERRGLGCIALRLLHLPIVLPPSPFSPCHRPGTIPHLVSALWIPFPVPSIRTPSLVPRRVHRYVPRSSAIFMVFLPPVLDCWHPAYLLTYFMEGSVLACSKILLALPFWGETLWCTQKRAKVWYPCKHFRHNWRIHLGFTTLTTMCFQFSMLNIFHPSGYHFKGRAKFMRQGALCLRRSLQLSTPYFTDLQFCQFGDI
jgi:hypothetical protein